MRTVKEVSKLTGVSIRTLQYYDKIGLLRPAAYTSSGYRQYDDTALERLQQILLYRALEFPLKDIKAIMDSPGYDRDKALEQQIELLLLKKEHIEHLILFARGMKLMGGSYMEFSAFDTDRMAAYRDQVKQSWGTTPEYKEFEQKSSDRTPSEEQALGAGLMAIVAEFGALQERSVTDPLVTAQVKKLRDYITEHYYTCSNTVLSSLGRMYAAGGEFTANIDAAGGPGTAAFANAAIQAYCGT